MAPIAAVQSEYSLWTRNPEIGVLAACRELGTAFFAFSPVGRAFLTGTLGDVRALAAEAGITPAQLALAWVLSRGDHVLTIPGTTRLAHLHENVAAANVRLPPSLAARAEGLFSPGRVVGGRYSAASHSEVDTEQFPPG